MDQNNQNQMIIVLDFGGQYNQLIARRVRDLGVYAEVFSHTTSLEEIKKINPSGIIFTGGPNSVNDPLSPHVDKEIFNLGIPILGICYGAQLIAYTLGGSVVTDNKSEYGKTDTKILDSSGLLKNVNNSTVWMSHTDHIDKLPSGFIVTQESLQCPVCAMENREKKIYAVQYHPEVRHTVDGDKVLYNFIYDVCKCTNSWEITDFLEKSISSLKEKIGEKKVLCALSGGVDSSVVAALLSRAASKNLICVFVNHGLLRKNEDLEVREVFENNKTFPMQFVYVDAKERFLNALKGVTEPEQKRKIIGNEFIKVFEEEAKKIGKVDFLAQGTIYPDVIESGLKGSATIKSHHNVGGLPSVVDFEEIIEPLRLLFKDEVRKLGLELGLSEKLVYRQPFPGPGLGIRIISDITEEKIKMVQDADFILREEIDNYAKEGMKKPSQYYVALTNMKTVGVMGDFRTYNYACVIRSVDTEDFMTANATNLPYELMQKVMTRIVNEVKGINRVFYDLTSKPPGTVEME